VESPTDLPSTIEREDELEDWLGRPSPADVAFARALDGDIAVLGAGGKMGPSLARRARLALEAAGLKRRVAAVSRFGDRAVVQGLEDAGVDALPCDLLDAAEVARLPTFDNVLFLAGMKFGSSGRPDLTWALNTIVPANVAQRFSASRLVVFSTGNVYPLVPPGTGGSRETDPPGPVGEYAQSCLGRERIFEHYSRERGTRVLVFRLFYAVDLRYGVVVDIARKVFAGEPIDLTVGYVHVIWQGDASSYALRSLGLVECPPRLLNVTGAEVASVRELALRFGRRFGREPRFTGSEGPVALLGDSSLCRSLLGPPSVTLDRLCEWTAHWVESGGRSLGKPTKYERSDGQF
jgi:nucleoside-diphosphate-sugar epimerase